MNARKSRSLRHAPSLVAIGINLRQHRDFKCAEEKLFERDATHKGCKGLREDPISVLLSCSGLEIQAATDGPTQT